MSARFVAASDHPVLGLETVHLRRELVQRIFPFVVARESGALHAGPADGVDPSMKTMHGAFCLARLRKGRGHARRPRRRTFRRNRNPKSRGTARWPARDGLGQQGLTCPREGLHEQRPLEILAPSLYLSDFLRKSTISMISTLASSRPATFLERHALGVVLVEDLRLGLAHVHNAPAASGAGAARHGAHDEEPRPDNDHPRQQ